MCSELPRVDYVPAATVAVDVNTSPSSHIMSAALGRSAQRLPFAVGALLVYAAAAASSATAVSALPADLGNFGSHNDLNGMSSFTLPDDRLAEQFVLAYVNYSYVAPDGQEVHFAEEKGKYGEGRIFNVRGLLVHVTSRYDELDHTACSPHIRGTRGRELPPPGTWVALIKRGKCNFEDKVKHAWMHKALGVIVYNDRDSSNLDKMKIIERDREYFVLWYYQYCLSNVDDVT